MTGVFFPVFPNLNRVLGIHFLPDPQQPFPHGVRRYIATINTDEPDLLIGFGLQVRIKIQFPVPTDGSVFPIDMNQRVRDWSLRARQIPINDRAYRGPNREAYLQDRQQKYLVRIRTVWQEVLLHNYDAIYQKILWTMAPNEPPFVAVNSTGDPSSDEGLLNLYVYHKSGGNFGERDRYCNRLGFAVAIFEQHGLLHPVTDGEFYNLSLRVFIPLQRTRLANLQHLTPPEIARVEEYEVPYLPPLANVIAHVGAYTFRHLTQRQLAVFPRNRMEELKLEAPQLLRFTRFSQ